jgi:hypothetical protein
VPKVPKSGSASLKTRKGRASLKTRKGRTSFKTRKKLVQGLPEFKKCPLGDKPSGLLPENCPNFSFFFVWAGTLWKLVTSPTLGRKNYYRKGNCALVVDRKASLNLKRALWGDKPEGLLPENRPNFSFFVWPGTLWALVTSPLRVLKEVRPDFDYFNYGPEKTTKYKKS